MLPIIASLLLAAGSMPYNAQDEAAARAWIAAAGHRFDVATLSDADLAPLADRLAGARVIGIGEATHRTHQDAAVKVELIKTLVRAGRIDALAIECNRAAAAALDHYVATGDGDPVAAMRSRSFFAIWRNDDFGGLVLWLRAWTAAGHAPIRIVGIDNQDSGTDAALALDFLGKRDRSAASAIRAGLGGLLSPSADASVGVWVGDNDKAAVEAALTASTDLEKRLANAPPAWRSARGYGDALYAAKVARQGLFEFSGEYRGADSSKLEAEYFNRRDRFMADNLLERIGAGRAALWAHDEHVAKGFGPIEEAQGWSSLGAVLRATLGERYRTVGFTWSRALIHAVALKRGLPPPPRGARHFSEIALGNQRPGDLGHVFDPLPGDAWWIDLAARPHDVALDRWAATPVHRGWAGWRIDADSWQVNSEDDASNPPDTGFDILVWFRAMSPSRSWPEPAASR